MRNFEIPNRSARRRTGTAAFGAPALSLLLSAFGVVPTLAQDPPPCGGDLEVGVSAVARWSKPCEYTFAAEPGHYVKVSIRSAPEFEPRVRLLGTASGELATESWQEDDAVIFTGRLTRQVTRIGRARKVQATPPSAAARGRPSATVAQPKASTKVRQPVPVERRASASSSRGRKVAKPAPREPKPRTYSYTLRVGSRDDRDGRFIVSLALRDYPYARLMPQRTGCVGGLIGEAPITKKIFGGTGGCEFEYLGMPGDVLTIAVNSTEVDPRVKIYLDDADDPLASNDNHGGSHNSLIEEQELAAEGIYHIYVSSRGARDGEFTLTVDNRRR